MTEPETNTGAVAAVAVAVSASKKQEEEEQQQKETNNNPPILSFFLNIFQLLPLPKKKKAEPISSEPARPIKNEAKPKPETESKPAVVTFPRQVEQELPSLKLENEDGDTNTNPLLLWQVYAIGGIFLLRWAWSKWNETRGKKKPPSDGEPPPSHDE